MGLDDLIKEQNDIKKDADHQLKFYADHKVDGPVKSHHSLSC
jgi:hypothetical protein